MLGIVSDANRVTSSRVMFQSPACTIWCAENDFQQGQYAYGSAWANPVEDCNRGVKITCPVQLQWEQSNCMHSRKLGPVQLKTASMGSNSPVQFSCHENSATEQVP